MTVEAPMKLFCDNKATISIANNMFNMTEQSMSRLIDTL